MIKRYFGRDGVDKLLYNNAYEIYSNQLVISVISGDGVREVGPHESWSLKTLILSLCAKVRIPLNVPLECGHGFL